MFEFTGAYEASLSRQLYNFGHALQAGMKSEIPPATPLNCDQAFDYLSSFLESKNIVNSKGGLHNRITRAPIQLLPFTLQETSEYMLSRGFKLRNYHILELYMAMGGVPQYLKQVQKGFT
ncbi:MAG: hypothetical protein EOO01_37700 [Chitinophagaceae bacterium]|nr:MAG: hypothetical protein EOO01_37700 [Chitinophagaceae bacterium]